MGRAATDALHLLEKLVEWKPAKLPDRGELRSLVFSSLAGEIS